MEYHEEKNTDQLSDSSPIVGHIKKNFNNQKHQEYMMRKDG